MSEDRSRPYGIGREGDIITVTDSRDDHVIIRGFSDLHTLTKFTAIAVALNDEHRRVYLPLEQKFEARTATANALQEAVDKHRD